MSTTLSVKRLQHPDDLRALASECDRLAHRMQPRLPFATSRWLCAWWDHYRESRLLVGDRFCGCAVYGADGELVALAPLVLTERPGLGPLRCRGLSFFGGDKNITEIRGLICAPEHEASATEALIEHVLEGPGSWDWFDWHGVQEGSAAHAALSRHPAFRWTHHVSDYVLNLPSTWEEFRGSRSRNIKESLRKCYNSLRRDGHEFSFHVVEQPSVLPAALQQFFVLHAARASAPGLPKHEDVFAASRARRLLHDLAATQSDSLSMRVFQLEIAGKQVAARLGFVLGDELYLYFSGYDPAWAAYSVMTTTVAESIQWAIANGFRSVNLSPGTDVSKTRWGARLIVSHNGVLVSPTARGRAAYSVQQELMQRSRSGSFLGRFLGHARRDG